MNPVLGGVHREESDKLCGVSCHYSNYIGVLWVRQNNSDVASNREVCRQ